VKRNMTEQDQEILLQRFRSRLTESLFSDTRHLHDRDWFSGRPD
jgi:hypothetical protein